ncbi:MAG: type II toxin-antitoxin system RelE/ParE family toxin [Deltaproteobacteria bacterium]|nr:type II toxin-antitoxin system RelE/ParE family toxin [Deltaproteobacteria bacterium]
MSYTVEIKRSAEKEMDRLPDKIHKRISEKILALETNPRPPGTKKLHGEEGYRLRMGDYRLVFE